VIRREVTAARALSCLSVVVRAAAFFAGSFLRIFVREESLGRALPDPRWLDDRRRAAPR
jgi:hypothetical protein